MSVSFGCRHGMVGKYDQMAQVKPPPFAVDNEPTPIHRTDPNDRVVDPFEGSMSRLAWLQQQRRSTAPLRDTLRTDDIPGAQADSSIHAQRKLHKPDLMTTVNDIEGAGPRTLIPNSVNNRVGLLQTSDIEGAQPRARGFRTNRCVNPLEPAYSLPTVEFSDDPAPPPTHETNFLDDIAGARPSSLYRFPEARPAYDDAQEMGARPKKSIRERKNVGDMTMNVKDINEDGLFRTKRRTDPLNPTYDIYASVIDAEKQKGNLHMIEEPLGNIDGAHPRPIYREVKKPDFALKTDDIPGAKRTDGPHLLPATFPKERKEVKDPLSVQDIPGASPQPKRATMHGGDTTRKLNPLTPEYNWDTGEGKRRPRNAPSASAKYVGGARKTGTPSGKGATESSTPAKLSPVRSASQPRQMNDDVQSVVDLPKY